ncbi:MAG: hypothetical protein D5R99_07695 [Methanocalculus sp. MSAO_Arc1]|uniref:hypothetical protein n=1 Tax=Methanocalculus TaxID=71151 RepID=UPI000FF19360|nr:MULTISPECIES: hypothetical protein [unclassified Methanocalculus]MCP1662027.1 hypothetical protein [Methanocalculus sp. AMF5]RQD79607.1 MAG: hypothetical protein D5R99_07695 [Methanocalculus sp. MSAO_Arc1]
MKHGLLGECIQEALRTGFTGEILYQDDTIERAAVIFISGEPAGAEYTDQAGSIFGDTAVLRLPIRSMYTPLPATAGEAAERARRMRIFHPKRLYAHATIKPEKTARSSDQGGAGTVTISLCEGRWIVPGLRVEIWSRGLIVGSDMPDQSGKASFRLLEGEYECRIRDGIRIVSRKTFQYPGGDLEIQVAENGAAQ